MRVSGVSQGRLLNLAFHRIDLRYLPERLLGNLALVGQLQVMELAPGMRPAAHLGDLLLCIAHELLVATEVIDHQ
jgi:hypothetical protein